MVGKKKKKIFIIAAILSAAAVLFLKSIYVRVETESFPFTESARKLSNPDRGFYHLYTFLITDEQEDYGKLIKTIVHDDADTEIMMVKICIQSYREGEISEKGLKNIKSLFDALKTLDKRIILRFVYDDEGK